MSVGYIPSVERLRLPSRNPQPWVSTPWTAVVASDPATASRRGRRGLILDLDETLYPRERFVSSGFAAVAGFAASAHGVDAQQAYSVLMRAHASAPGREFQALCDRFEISLDQVALMLDVFRRHLPSIQLNHDVTETLQSIHAAGWRIAILTNGLPSVQFRKIAALGLSLLVDEVIYAEEHAPGGKPSAAAYRAALSALELAAEQCVSVGDDLVNDIQGARAVGLRTIRITREMPGTPIDDDADVVVDSFAQVPEAASLLLGMVTGNVA